MFRCLSTQLRHLLYAVEYARVGKATLLYKQWQITLYHKYCKLRFDPSGLWPSCPLGIPNLRSTCALGQQVNVVV
jgi:hypothetical protein